MPNSWSVIITSAAQEEAAILKAQQIAGFYEPPPELFPVGTARSSGLNPVSCKLDDMPIYVAGDYAAYSVEVIGSELRGGNLQTIESVDESLASGAFSVFIPRERVYTLLLDSGSERETEVTVSETVASRIFGDTYTPPQSFEVGDRLVADLYGIPFGLDIVWTGRADQLRTLTGNRFLNQAPLEMSPQPRWYERVYSLALQGEIIAHVSQRQLERLMDGICEAQLVPMPNVSQPTLAVSICDSTILIPATQDGVLKYADLFDALPHCDWLIPTDFEDFEGFKSGQLFVDNRGDLVFIASAQLTRLGLAYRLYRRGVYSEFRGVDGQLLTAIPERLLVDMVFGKDAARKYVEGLR